MVFFDRPLRERSLKLSAARSETAQGEGEGKGRGTIEGRFNNADLVPMSVGSSDGSAALRTCLQWSSNLRVVERGTQQRTQARWRQEAGFSELTRRKRCKIGALAFSAQSFRGSSSARELQRGSASGGPR
jgi:hypothetical protein